MRLLLDTVTFVWAVASPERLSEKVMSALQSEETVREMSAISLAELAIKQTMGKLSFRREDVIAGISDLQVHILPYTAEHAYQLFSLPNHHSDRFDRQIIAQALVENIPVVTSDERFGLYKGLKIIW